MSALNKKSFLTYLKEGGIYVVLLVLLAIIIFQDPTFLSLLNLSNILTQSSVRIIIALGVAGLIVTQGTDLDGLCQRTRHRGGGKHQRTAKNHRLTPKAVCHRPVD